MHLKLFVVEYEILNRDRIESWGSKAAVRKLRFEALLCLYCTAVPVPSSVLYLVYVVACALRCTVIYVGACAFLRCFFLLPYVGACAYRCTVWYCTCCTVLLLLYLLYSFSFEI